MTNSPSIADPDSFLPPAPDAELAGHPPRGSSGSASPLRGNVLRFEPEDRERFCLGLGLLRAGAVRELLPSPVC
jgi:hypothetical protein